MDPLKKAAAAAASAEVQARAVAAHRAALAASRRRDVADLLPAAADPSPMPQWVAGPTMPPPTTFVDQANNIGATSSIMPMPMQGPAGGFGDFLARLTTAEKITIGLAVVGLGIKLFAARK